jgi:hypothetical protein
MATLSGFNGNADGKTRLLFPWAIIHEDPQSGKDDRFWAII